MLRAALVCGTLRLRTNCRLTEVFIKPILLHGLGTSIARKTVIAIEKAEPSCP